MSIENPTLVHFRHSSSLFTNFPSTTVEKTLQISLFMQNKPNSPNVQTDLTNLITMIYAYFHSLTKVKNKANSNPIQSQTNPILAQNQGWQTQNKPNQSHFLNPLKVILYSMMLRAYPNNLVVMRPSEKFEAKMEKQKIAYIYAAVAILFWSTIAAVFKISLPYYSDVLDLHLLHLLFFASLISSIALFLHLLISNKLNLIKSFSKTDYLYSALMGFLSPFLYYLILLNAYSILSAQEAMTLNWLWPMTLVLLSIPLLKQKIKSRSIIAITISFFGVFIIATRGNLLGFKFTNPIGILLALGSTIIWALFWIYNTKDKQDETVRLFLNFIFGTFFIFISIVIFDKMKMPDMKGMLGAAYIGLFELGITFLLWLKALKLSKTTAHVANLVFLAPFLSLVVISFVVEEKILISTVIGLIFIVGGIIVQKLSYHDLKNILVNYFMI